MDNYFNIFGLLITLNIDKKELQKKFYELSKKTHPDFFVNASPSQKKASLEMSSKLNEAFKTLSDETKRFYYVADLFLGKAAEKEKKTSPQLLMQMMEIREKAEEFSQKKTSEARNELEEKLKELKELSMKYDKELKNQAKIFDESEDLDLKKETLQTIRSLLFKKNYLRSLFQSIETVLI